MSALLLIDLVLSGAGPTAVDGRATSAVVQATSWATRLVESTIAEWDDLRTIEDDLTPAEEREFDRPAAELLHAAYEQWSQRAGMLIRRLDRIERRGGRVPRADELRDRFGRVMAMLQVTLDDAEEADEQIRRGQEYTIEEVRDELRAAVRAEGAGGPGRVGRVAPGTDAGRDRAAG